MMMRFVFKLAIALSMLTLCLSIPTSTESSTAVSSTADDPEDLFMICSPMKSRQQLVQMLHQSGQQLKSELLASAAQGESAESPDARSNQIVEASIEKVMSVLHPGHESSSSTTTLTPSTTTLFASTAGPMESESTSTEPTTVQVNLNQTEVASAPVVEQSDSSNLMHLPLAQPLTAEQDLNETSKIQTRDAATQRQSTLVSQLIHMLPNQIQDKLNQSNLMLFKSKPTTTSTTTVATSSTSTTFAPSTESPEPTVTEPISSNTDSNENNQVLDKESAQPLVSTSAADETDSKSTQLNSTTEEQNEKIFKEFFGRQNNPSSLNLLVDSVKSRLGFGTQASVESPAASNAMDERKLVELQSALKNSNGPLKTQHVDEYDRFETEKTTQAPITKATLPVKQSLVDKLAAFARFTSTTTSTPSPKTVLFPAAPALDLDAHSKLIDLKLKEKLNHLEHLKEAIEEKKKLKTTTTTERTTTADYYPPRPASGYSSNPLPYQKPVPARYPAVLAVPSSGYQSGYGSSDGYRAVSAFRPPYENQRSGYVYPIYGY